MDLDYLIIGCGLAGISFAEYALADTKKILLIDDNSQNSSKIAGGLYNPVILKRFSEVWQAKEQLALLDDFYSNLENKLNEKVNFQIPILRKFFSIEEQNNWFIASDKPNLAPFLSSTLITDKYSFIQSPFNFGQVLKTGYVDTALLVEKYKNYLIHSNLLLSDSFDYQRLFFFDDYIQYNEYKIKQVIFAEGFGLSRNPFFNYLPLDGTKGELLVIKAPLLNLKVIINTSIFILPLGNDLFKVGATYNWEDKTDIPSEEAKNELIEKINEILDCDFEIIAHFAGIRPTVRDRKPLVGTHKKHQRLHILNGLGTRGVMLAPAMAKALYNHIENEESLDKVIDIKRFEKKQ